MTERKETTGSLIAVLYCEDCDRVIMSTAVSGKNRDRFYPDQLELVSKHANHHAKMTGHKLNIKMK